MVVRFETGVPLEAAFGHADVTDWVRRKLTESAIVDGIVTLQAVGSTGGLTTIEYEPGALADLERALERMAPEAGHYEHNERWHDGNGFSHLRSAIIGTSFTTPVRSGELELGAWQQIVLLNFDNRARKRPLVCTLVGDE